jgi:hypothetical protein
MSDGEFWQVADIDVSGGTLTPIGNITADVP